MYPEATGFFTRDFFHVCFLRAPLLALQLMLYNNFGFKGKYYRLIVYGFTVRLTRTHVNYFRKTACLQSIHSIVLLSECDVNVQLCCLIISGHPKIEWQWTWFLLYLADEQNTGWQDFRGVFVFGRGEGSLTERNTERGSFLNEPWLNIAHPSWLGQRGGRQTGRCVYVYVCDLRALTRGSWERDHGGITVWTT